MEKEATRGETEVSSEFHADDPRGNAIPGRRRKTQNEGIVHCRQDSLMIPEEMEYLQGDEKRKMRQPLVATRIPVLRPLVPAAAGHPPVAPHPAASQCTHEKAYALRVLVALGIAPESSRSARRV